MKLQAVALAAFVAVAATSADAKQGGVRRKTKEGANKNNNKARRVQNKKHVAGHDDRKDKVQKKNKVQKKKHQAAARKKRELGSKKKNKCDVPIFPTTCVSGDLQPSWVGVKGEVCLSAGDSLCRNKNNWQFGVTAPMPMMGGGGMMDPIPLPSQWPELYPSGPTPWPGVNTCEPNCVLPDFSKVKAQSEPTYAMNGGDRRKLGKKKGPKPSGSYWMYPGTPTVLPSPMMPSKEPWEPPLPYNLTDASAHLWRGSDCDPVFSFPRPTTDVCVGMVGLNDFTNSSFAASSYLTFKNSTLPGSANPNGDADLDGDYWLLFHPLVGGDWKSMPRLNLVPKLDDGIVVKFQRGPEGKDNEDLLMLIDKDGEVGVNPYGQAFFAPGGDRTAAFEIGVDVVFPPQMIMPPDMLGIYFPIGNSYSF